VPWMKGKLVTTRTTGPAAKGSKAEGIAQIAIMLAIGIAAGAASFTHVHNVAAAHGQNGWLAWADAVVLELMSIASGLELRRRKRQHMAVRFPALVLVSATALSISAQVVEAQRSVIGWIAAAVPALGFLVMVKIALARSDSGETVPTSTATDGIALVATGGDLAAHAEVADGVSGAGDSVAAAERHVSSMGERTVPGQTRASAARRRPRVEPADRAARIAALRPDPKVPATAAALAQWAETWVGMCADGTTIHGPLNDDDYARSRYQLSAKQLRNVRNAATSGALRRRAVELGVPLPADYVDRPVVDVGLLTAV
jgi:hypothetical protein